MINLENLNDKPIKQILEEAKAKIELNPKWTYKGESDPGVTILELLVWLIYVQREYLNKISPLLGVKLLRLLGIKFEKNRGSKTLLEVTNLDADAPCLQVPIGTKWLADDMIFENINQENLINSQILSIKFTNPEFSKEEEYYKFDGSKKFLLFGKNPVKIPDSRTVQNFCINFDKPFPMDKLINIYFEIFLEPEFNRNPIKKDFDPMAIVEWKYFGKKNKKIGWHKINVTDLTYNFIFSGIIRLKIDGEMLPPDQEGLYCIKVELISSDYDFAPQITKVLTNVFEIEQKDTHCEKIIVKKHQMVKQKMHTNNNKIKYIDPNITISHHLAIYGNVLIYYKSPEDKWIEYRNFTKKIDKVKGEIVVTLENINFIKKFKYNKDVLMIILYSNYIRPKMIIGNGLGYSGQMFNISYDGIPIYKDFKLLVGEESNNKLAFDIWERSDDFFYLSKTDKKFVFEENINVIFFGDNVKGLIPKNGRKNIRLCNLAFTEQEKSNIKSHSIKKVITENETLSNARITQITEAKGGRGNASLFNTWQRGLELFLGKKRAVTENDYIKIVMNTPGLIITSVAVIAGYSEKTQKSSSASKIIGIVARCGNRPTLPESYRKNIIRRLNKYRLINTQIKIIDIKNIIISIFANIYVNSNFKSKNNNILISKIEEFIFNLNKKIGQPLMSSEIFAILEKSEYIYSVKALKIIPDPNFACFKVSEDIIAPPNGIYQIKKIDINHVIYAR
ncbi:MAG: baseplate J/gp47 family protein [Candidatus Improbicoccus devescovinae]|nr:MAG: baseplate J/gp47 family protein [Candidatus Improbicoccus devescovinae]